MLMPIQSGWFRALIVLLVFAVAVHIGGLLWDLIVRFGDIIMLFVLAWMVAFVLRPPARWLHARQGVPWGLSVGGVYLFFFTAVLASGALLIPLLITQISQMLANVPRWLQDLPGWFAAAQGYVPESLWSENLESVYDERSLIAQVQQILTGLLQNALGLATGVATAMVGLVLVLVLSFYITLDGDRIGKQLYRIVPSEHKEKVRFFKESVDRSFGGFLRGQVIQAFVYAAGTAVVMLVAGLPFVALAVTVAGLAMVIPFIGPAIAIVLPLIIAALQGSVSVLIGVFVALLALQQLVFNVLAPKVMSQAVGIHPLLVLLAILVGAKVAGLAGAIFGVPVAAVLSAMAGFFYHRAHAADESIPEIDSLEAAGLPPAGQARIAGGCVGQDMFESGTPPARHKETGGKSNSESS
jgi:predicted PurR-regulated permease PerM